MNNQVNKNVGQKPLLRGHFHQAMFFVSLGSCTLLLLKCDNQTEFIPILIYSIGLLIMFGVSALYHRITWMPSRRLIMKRLDHASIYIMIAGSFTPITKLGMNSPDGENLLSVFGLDCFKLSEDAFIASRIFTSRNEAILHLRKYAWKYFDNETDFNEAISLLMISNTIIMNNIVAVIVSHSNSEIQE